MLGPYPFVFLDHGSLSVSTFPCTILASGGDSLVRSDYLQYQGSWEGGLQNPPSGSLEMPSPQSTYPILDMAPAHPGELVGVCRAPLGPSTPACSPTAPLPFPI